MRLVCQQCGRSFAGRSEVQGFCGFCSQRAVDPKEIARRVSERALELGLRPWQELKTEQKVRLYRLATATVWWSESEPIDLELFAAGYVRLNRRLGTTMSSLSVLEYYDSCWAIDPVAAVVEEGM